MWSNVFKEAIGQQYWKSCRNELERCNLDYIDGYV